MAKVISSGILVKFGDKYILGHATGCDHYDMFKGRMDEGESYIDTAIRECKEESGLEFKKHELKFLGLHLYTKKKDLAIYIAKVSSIDMDALKCSTFLENGNPEMDWYVTVTWEDMLTKLGHSMSLLFKTLESEIENF